MWRKLLHTYIPVCVVFVTFNAVSKIIFDKVYVASKQIIDEEFHIPQGLAYCNYHFDTWNPKITTLPGLYLISMLFLAPFDLCLIYWLRFVNLVASLLNLYLFYALFRLHNRKTDTWKILLSSINLAILPPLYFFSHVYYTDVLSLTFILLMLIFEKKGNHNMTAFAGMGSIIMRQTNVIWVIMIFGRYLLTNVIHHCLKKKHVPHERSISEGDLRVLKRGISFKNFSLDVWLNLAVYMIVMASFAAFVLFNGGIVVGDKEAHTVSLHFPQIFYFSLFCFVFSWPYFVPKVSTFCKFIWRHKLIVGLAVVALMGVVYYNTLVHPYLLADNRHYTFYIWNRAYGRYPTVRYCMVFAYMFFLYCIWQLIYSKDDVSFALVYVPCTTLVLTLQKMIEVRYFLVPYILLRFCVKDVTYKQLCAEFLFSLLINYLTFNVFFTKNIYWVDYYHAQKIIW